MEFFDYFLWLPLLLVVLLLGSAFFSGAETALTGASRARLHALACAGDARARKVEKLRQNKERLIWTILIGNNLINILATAVVSSSLSMTLGGDVGVVIATVLMTVLILIFGEILPKTYALMHTEAVALRMATPVAWAEWFLYPVTFVLRAALGRATRYFAHGTEGKSGVSETDMLLRGAIALHSASRDEEERMEGRMLSGILDLDEVEIGHVMTHRRHLVMLDAALDSTEIAKHVVSKHYSHFPLYRDNPDNIVGILNTKALLVALWRHRFEPEKLEIAEWMKPPVYALETTTLRQQLENFRHRGARAALVVDEYGDLMGMVTMTDILEEIVGDLDASTLDLGSEIKPDRDQSVTVRGTVTIRDLNRAMGWDIPDDRAVTVAGLVLREARMIPDVGRVFAFHGYRFKVLRRQRNQIVSLHLRRLD